MSMEEENQHLKQRVLQSSPQKKYSEQIIPLGELSGAKHENKENKSRNQSVISENKSEKSALEIVKSAVRTFLTVHCSECDEWKHINPYITHHYRHGYVSYWDYFHSIFKWHNETMNIWTHLIGGLYFLYCALYLILDLYKYEDGLGFKYDSLAR